MNTSTHTGVPISVTRAIKQRFGDGKWWAEEGTVEALRYATPMGWSYNVSLGLIGFTRKVNDPTSRSIPLMGENPEAKFFSMWKSSSLWMETRLISEVRKSIPLTAGTESLPTQNERSEKGFVPTNELGKTYGPIGRYKLDWIFVRPAELKRPNGNSEESRFVP